MNYDDDDDCYDNCPECGKRKKERFEYCWNCAQEYGGGGGGRGTPIRIPVNFDILVQITDKAYLIQIGIGGVFAKTKKYWLPKSQVEIEDNVAWVPQWLAIEKELI